MPEVMDVFGDVRRDGEYYSLKEFIQPDEPTIQKIAAALHKSDDPIATAQDFVHLLVKYTEQTGEYFRYPTETLRAKKGDCDDSSILLTSILRNYFSPDAVFTAVGTMDGGGHAWVVLTENHNFRIIESTSSSKRRVNETKYKPDVFFNDKYTYKLNGAEYGFVVIAGRYNMKVE